MKISYADRVKADLIINLHDETVRMTVNIMSLTRQMVAAGHGELARKALKAGWEEGAPKDGSV